MKQTILAIAVLAIVVLYIWLRYGTVTVVYDCTLIENYSDVPREVKEECRKLRIEQNKSRNYI